MSVNCLTQWTSTGSIKAGPAWLSHQGGDSGKAANKRLHQTVALYPDRLVGYAGVIPYANDGPEFLRYCVDTYGFRALKLHPSIQQFYPDDRRIFPVVEEAIKLDIPILIHTGAVPIPAPRLNTTTRFTSMNLHWYIPKQKL